MVLGVFVVVFVIVSLSSTSLVLLLIVLLIIWFTFRSYRNWASRKSERDIEHKTGTAEVLDSGWHISTETLFHKD